MQGKKKKKGEDALWEMSNQAMWEEKKEVQKKVVRGEIEC